LSAPGPRMPDVLVVGGGPAGSVTSLLLARAGFDVTLIDRARFPRAKACGEFVNPGAIRLLDRLGLLDAVATSTENTITGWNLSTERSPVAMGGYGPTSWGVGVSRSAFDMRLLEAARGAGVRVREGVVARAVATGPVAVTVRRDRGAPEQLRARILVGADGLNSVVSRTLGGLRRAPRRVKVSLSAHLRGTGPGRDRGHLFVGDGVTVGLAATGPADGWNATVVVDRLSDRRAVAADPASFLIDRLARLSLPWQGSPTLVDGPWTSGPFDRPVTRVAGSDFVLVGDASGYYDPLTGQGIYRALRSAELAVPQVATALKRPGRAAKSLRAYQHALTKDRRSGRFVQHAVDRVMASGRAREWMVPRLAQRNSALNALLQVTGDIASVSSLARPSVWAPLLRPGSHVLAGSA